MKNARVGLLAGFGALAGLAFFAGNSDAKPETMTKIADGVWFREGDLKNLGHCNNILIEMKDYLIVVDANFPSGARAMMADVKKVSSKPVKYVFDTHHHADHAYGNSVWTSAGATTLAYKGVAEEMKRNEPKAWMNSTRKDVREMNQSSVEPPKQTFDKTPFVIEDGTRRVEFHFLGWAHTRGDGFVFLPKEKILCTGDAAANGPFNATGDANLGNWPKVLAAAQEKFNATRVLPGHGEPGGKEILAGQAHFMIELHKAVQSEIGKGKKLNELVEFKDGKAVMTSLKLPDSVGHWVGPSLPLQVQHTFDEIAQGKPHGEIKSGK